MGQSYPKKKVFDVYLKLTCIFYFYLLNMATLARQILGLFVTPDHESSVYLDARHGESVSECHKNAT